MTTDTDATIRVGRYLTDLQIRDIKIRLVRGDTQQEVADAYGVARSTVANYAPETTPPPPLGFGQVPDWYDDALCSQTDPERFYPEKGGSTREARKVCGRCDVREQCLEFALDNRERFGIWGGVSERKRRKILIDRGLEEQVAS